MISLDWTSIFPVACIGGATLALFLGVQGGFAAWRKVTFIQHERAMLAIRRAREEAKTQHILASANATEAIAQHKARLIPVNAGGSFGVWDSHTGAYVAPVVNHTQTRGTPQTQEPVPEPPKPVELPGPVDFAHLLSTFTPTRDRILLALGPGSTPITVSWRDMFHVALAGATRSGKTNIIRLLAAQLLSLKAQVYLADLKYTPFDPDTGEDWRPIEARLAQPPARTVPDIRTLIMWIATSELPRRNDARYRGERIGPAMFLILDEIPWLIREWPEAAEYLAAILQVGAGLGIMIIGAAQDFLVKTIGGSGGVRDCYRTAYYSGGDAQTARVLLDLQGRAARVLDEVPLGRGIVFLRQHTTQAERVRVPFASNDAIYALLGKPNNPAYGTEQTEQERTPAAQKQTIIVGGANAVPESKVDIAMRYYQPGMSVRDLVAAVRNATGDSCSTDTALKAIRRMKGVQSE